MDSVEHARQFHERYFPEFELFGTPVRFNYCRDGDASAGIGNSGGASGGSGGTDGGAGGEDWLCLRVRLTTRYNSYMKACSDIIYCC